MTQRLHVTGPNSGTITNHVQPGCGAEVIVQGWHAGSREGYLEGPLEELEEERLGVGVGDSAPRRQRLVRGIEDAVEQAIVAAVHRAHVVRQRRKHLDHAARRHRRVPAPGPAGRNNRGAEPECSAHRSLAPPPPAGAMGILQSERGPMDAAETGNGRAWPAVKPWPKRGRACRYSGRVLPLRHGHMPQ